MAVASSAISMPAPPAKQLLLWGRLTPVNGLVSVLSRIRMECHLQSESHIPRLPRCDGAQAAASVFHGDIPACLMALEKQLRKVSLIYFPPATHSFLSVGHLLTYTKSQPLLRLW